MRIDAHHHIWDLQKHPQTWMTTAQSESIGRNFGMDDWEAVANPTGFGASIVVQTVESFEESLDLLQLSTQTPSIAGIVGWVDANRPDPGAQIAHLKDSPGGDALVSVRDLTEYRTDEQWLSGPDAARLFDAAAEHGIAVDLLIRPIHIPAALNGVRNHPQTRFIINHLAKPDLDRTNPKEWQHTLAGFAATPNVALKFSGVGTLTACPEQLGDTAGAFLSQAWKTFGPDRVMFGSDWPVSNTGLTYGALIKSIEEALTDATIGERNLFWSGAARQWYKLEGFAN